MTFFNIYQGFEDNNFPLTYPSAQGYFYSISMSQAAKAKNLTTGNTFSIESAENDADTDIMTVVTTEAHGLSSTQQVLLSGIDCDTSGSFGNPNGTFTATVVSTTTFTVPTTQDPQIFSVTPKTVEILSKNATTSSSAISNSSGFTFLIQMQLDYIDQIQEKVGLQQLVTQLI